MALAQCNCGMCIEEREKRKGIDMARKGFFDVVKLRKRNPAFDVAEFAVMDFEARPVSLAKPEKPKRKVIEDGKRAPSGLAKLRKTMIAYFENPSAFLDMSTLRDQGGYSRGTYTVQGKRLEDVCGIERLGSGHYSDVYAIDETRVIKVVKQGDSGFARFVKVIRPLNNPHFPKILYASIWGGKQIYIMERLTPSAATLGYDDADAFRQIMRQGPNPWVKFATPEMEQAAAIMKEHNLDSDFHGDNLMWRGDVPVINDPTSEGSY